LRFRRFSSALGALLLAAPLAAAPDGITLGTPGALQATLVSTPTPDARLASVGASAPGHYLHPLVAPGGLLTALFPADHVHHRGLFWGWRQILRDGKPVANGWLLTGLEMRSLGATRSADGRKASSRLRWSIAGEDVLEEQVSVGVEGMALTLELRLLALVPGLSLGGSPDAKEYGGVSLRLVHGDRLRFESGGRAVAPAPGPVEAGPELRFSWDTGTPAPARAFSLACTAGGRPITRWVLRRELSMQNCVWPGSTPVTLQPGEPVILTARLSVEP
jgi:hypothetical protein